MDVVRTIRGWNWLAGMLTAMIMTSVQAGGSEEHFEHDANFAAWLGEVKAEAVASGIAPGLFDEIVGRVRPIPRVIALDRRQPEFTLTLEQYMASALSQERIRTGRRQMKENRSLLQKIEKTYNVQPAYLVALWGIETSYGRATGGFPVIDALTTLAYEGRRGPFFRGQLIDALHILQQGHVEVRQMRGSWAGAMGQPQFMPSTFRRYGVDFDGDGRVDIWNSRADVFASAANYLSQIGWRGDQGWGVEVTLPVGFDTSLIGGAHRRPQKDWQALGVHRRDGRHFTDPAREAILIQPDKGGRAFLVYGNFIALLDWNYSERFALTVSRLADLIARDQ